MESKRGRELMVRADADIQGGWWSEMVAVTAGLAQKLGTEG